MLTILELVLTEEMYIKGRSEKQEVFRETQVAGKPLGGKQLTTDLEKLLRN